MVDHRQGSAFPWGLMGRQQVAEHRRAGWKLSARWLMEVGWGDLGCPEWDATSEASRVSTEGAHVPQLQQSGEE